MEKPPFDDLCRLAQTDPVAFERLRTRLIDQLIDEAPLHRRDRLRGLQFVVDSRRSLAGNPVKAMVEIQSMMHASLAKLRGLLKTTGQQTHQSHSHTSNVVLFNRRQEMESMR